MLQAGPRWEEMSGGGEGPGSGSNREASPSWVGQMNHYFLGGSPTTTTGWRLQSLLWPSWWLVQRSVSTLDPLLGYEVTTKVAGASVLQKGTKQGKVHVHRWGGVSALPAGTPVDLLGSSQKQHGTHSFNYRQYIAGLQSE